MGLETRLGRRRRFRFSSYTEARLFCCCCSFDQEHLANTFKHVLIFEALGVEAPKTAHLPLLMAPDGAKLSKRIHGPVVSVTTYRDAGFLPAAFVNFLSLVGWSTRVVSRRFARGWQHRYFLTAPRFVAANYRRVLAS